MEPKKLNALVLHPALSERGFEYKRNSVEFSCPAMPVTVRSKYFGVRIRHPCICARCRRFKLQGFYGSFPPKNFCICPSDSNMKSAYSLASTFKLPSNLTKPLIATGFALPTKILESGSETVVNRMDMKNLRKIIDKDFDEKDEDGIVKVAHEDEKSEKPEVKKFIIFQGNNSKIVKKYFIEKNDWTEGEFSYLHEASFIWQPFLKNINFRKFNTLAAPPLLNHFEKHSELSDKSKLFMNLSTYCKKHSMNLSSLVPVTFLVDTKSKNLNNQVGLFMNYFRALRGETKGKMGFDPEVNQAVAETHFIGKNIWLIKPADNNRGKGIRIFNTLAEFKSIISESVSGQGIKKASKSGRFIIQKYVESPLVINMRKFDIRIWVLITQNLKAFCYSEGYIRTSSEMFSLDENLLNSAFVHLTNNAVQKESCEYSKYEPGNQLSFGFARSYFRENHKAEFDDILDSIKMQLSTAVGATVGKLNPNNYKCSFEIFGFDFIIDSDFKPWLIECNTNPCLELSSPLLSELIPEMLFSAFNLLFTSDEISSPKWECLQYHPKLPI